MPTANNISALAAATAAAATATAASDSYPATGLPSIAATFGTLYIGAILATVLFGFTTNQAFLYYKKYGSEDGMPTRLLVLVLWVLDSFQVALVIDFTWYYLVKGFGSTALLTRLVWSFCLELGVTVLVTFIVRALYLKQLWRLSGKRLWILVPAFIFAAGQLCLGFQITVNVIQHPTTAIVMTRSFQWILGSKCAVSVLADVIITLSLCYYLHVSRTGFRKTNDIVNALLVYTINRGVLAMLMEATVMITFLTMKHNYIFAALHLMLGKLHTSSLFALLLQRDTLRARPDTSNTDIFTDMVEPTDSALRHISQHSHHSSNHDIEVRITRDINHDIEVRITRETVVGDEEDQFDNQVQVRRAKGKTYPYNPKNMSW